jgi:hypothetical protein
MGMSVATAQLTMPSLSANETSLSKVPEMYSRACNSVTHLAHSCCAPFPKARNFPVLAESCLSPRGTERCKKFYLEFSRIEITRAIGSSAACEIFKGFLDKMPVAIKKLRTHLMRSNSTPELDDLVNEINFMSRCALPALPDRLSLFLKNNMY